MKRIARLKPRNLWRGLKWKKKNLIL